MTVRVRQRFLAGVGVPMAGCALAVLDLPAGGSPSGRAIEALYDTVNTTGIIVLILVEALLLYAVWRYTRKGPDEPPAIAPKARVGWVFLFILVPILILGIILFPTLATMEELDRHPPETLRIEVLAMQWSWLVRYPDNQTELGVIQVEEGTHLLIELRTFDVVHNLFVPKLGLKKDAVPGRVNTVRVTLDEPGVYLGVCAEFCGIGHADMPLRVVVFERGERSVPYGPADG